MSAPRRIVIIGSCSGQGKTTLGRALAARLQVTFVELDGWVHGPDWTETPDAELAARLAPVLASEAWVIDGTYEAKLGRRVLDAADLVIWLDLPPRLWVPRLLRRTLARVILRRELWNGNRESLRSAFWGRESLFGYAITTSRDRRREWPISLAAYPMVRLGSDAEVLALLEDLTGG